ncbi:MAG TPA: phosphonate metabolism transcriptional regulator PhnF [Rhodospirillaceae bacterium]|nr:phosphonate metabolism transcriptional regulator PhnF [Rhodospirillaceae bacterium]
MTNDIDRHGGKAVWRQIADHLEADIMAGRLKPGERLATEHDLARQFAVNRHTARRALAALADMGMVRTEQGRGSFVQEHVIDYRVRRRTRFSENISAARREPGGRLLDERDLPADEDLAAKLDIPRGSPVLMLRILGEADGRPISLASHYFPKDRFPGLADAFRDTGSITKALARCGVADYLRRHTRVTARMPRAEDLRALQQPANRPILQAESLNVDTDGRPVFFTVARFASDRVQLVFEP